MENVTPPPPPSTITIFNMHKVCPLLSSPILLRQKFTNLKPYSQSCSRSSVCFGFWEESCDKDFLFNNVQPPPSYCQTFLQVAATRFLRLVKPLGYVDTLNSAKLIVLDINTTPKTTKTELSRRTPLCCCFFRCRVDVLRS